MGYVDLSKDGIAIIGQDDACHADHDLDGPEIVKYSQEILAAFIAHLRSRRATS
jgi:hypothetical protein